MDKGEVFLPCHTASISGLLEISISCPKVFWVTRVTRGPVRSSLLDCIHPLQLVALRSLTNSGVLMNWSTAHSKKYCDQMKCPSSNLVLSGFRCSGCPNRSICLPPIWCPPPWFGVAEPEVEVRPSVTEIQKVLTGCMITLDTQKIGGQKER